ncbi:MAG: hypothetical protein ACPKQO_11290 [Nitrososphaeraceae archaeon]
MRKSLLTIGIVSLFFVSSFVDFGYGQTFGELGNKILQGLADLVEQEKKVCKQLEDFIKDPATIEDFDPEHIKNCEHVLDIDIDVIDN